MYKHGYMKVALATPKISIGNPLLNVEPILSILDKQEASITVFPELSITGYTAGDLFFQSSFLTQAYQALEEIMNRTTYEGTYILGMPYSIHDCLYNVAVVVQKKKLLGIVPKYFLPNFREFYEKRWFQSGLTIHEEYVTLLGQKVPFGQMIFTDEKEEVSFGVEICQDMWTIQTPADTLSLAGAHLLINISASTEFVSKVEQRQYTVLNASRKQNSAYVYTSNGSSESTTDVVYSSHKLAASLGDMIAEDDFLKDTEVLVVDIDIDAIKYARKIDSTYRDQQIYQPVSIKKIPYRLLVTNKYRFDILPDQMPFIPRKNEVFNYAIAHKIQTSGLIQKLKALPNSKIIIGVSGGLDSTLALIIAHSAIKVLKRDPKDIIAVTMPADATSKRSKSDALQLMEKLGVTALEIPIKEMLIQHLKDIKHDKEDVTYENAQARIRTLVLMDIANKEQGFVLGTGDLSEIALGWMTFNGDQMSMYGVNSGVTKTFVQALLRYHIENDYQYLNEIIGSILSAPISPELIKGQKTEDSVGKYEMNDFILYHHLVQGADEIKASWLLEHVFKLDKEIALTYAKRFFDRFYSQQFKRQPMPEGPKVLKISLSPRGELRLPSDMKRK